MCFVIALVAYPRGRKSFTFYDWVSLAGSFAAILLWLLVKSPTGSVIIVSTINVIGVIPTLRKSYTYPYEESLTAFALNGLKFIVAAAALQSYSIATWLFPAATMLVNGSVVGLLLVRRSQLSPRSGGV
jgi:hypothetical protein